MTQREQIAKLESELENTRVHGYNWMDRATELEAALSKYIEAHDADVADIYDLTGDTSTATPVCDCAMCVQARRLLAKKGQNDIHN